LLGSSISNGKFWSILAAGYQERKGHKMPNIENAGSPITLLGIGRSGTSLLEACFRTHAKVQSIGETSGLIFSTANGAHSALIPSIHKYPDRYDYDGHVVRQLLVALEPSYKERWFHKPIGVPKLIAWWQLPGEKTTNGFPIEWYWRVLEAAFPAGRYLACLRNPWDVVLSWQRFAGWNQKDLWRDILISYRVISHGMERFDIIIMFDELINRAKETLRSVFRAVDLPMAEKALAAYDRPRSMKGNRIMNSHKEFWSTCERPNISEEEASDIVAIWKQSGHSFESPEEYASLFRF
jgi:hypothetical protein